MRFVSQAVGTAILSCGFFVGCGGGESAGPGAASEAEAKNPETGKAAMEKMKAMQKDLGQPVSNPGAGQSAMEKMRSMQRGGGR